MLAAKITQAHHSKQHRDPDPEFAVNDHVMLATARRRRDYMQAKDGRVAKFMPRFDGPYEVLEAYPESSTYKLALPHASKQCPSFHVSQLRPYIENDAELFPARELARPGPIVTEADTTEYFIEYILDERPRGRGKQYLVRWVGYGPDADLWIPCSELLETEALDKWIARRDEE
jgi:Chromo (CHRromatin Organisation MOdifier) domain